jgi:hypothetical protein
LLLWLVLLIEGLLRRRRGEPVGGRRMRGAAKPKLGGKVVLVRGVVGVLISSRCCNEASVALSHPEVQLASSLVRRERSPVP